MSDLNIVKLTLVGNGSVGKTSIINRFVEDGFERVYRQTIGVDFFEKSIFISNNQIKIQVWDIGGQSIASKMLNKYITGSNVVLLCYDITDQSSFNDMEDWLIKVRKYINQETNPLICLVGNKCDLLHLRTVPESLHNQFIERNHLDSGFFISAKTGDKVLRVIYQIAAKASNVELTAHELGFTDRVVNVTIATTNSNDEDDEGRTPWADEIEKEDLEAMKNQKKKKRSSCCIM